MKRFVKIIMVLVSVTICCGIMYGQGRPDRVKRMAREQLAAVQAKHISDALSLDDETSGIFIDTYCRFQEEIWALGPRPGRYGHKTDSTATAEEIDKSIQDKFERSRQILEIREKYYEEYSRFLSPKQIQEMYEIERRMMDRLSRRSGNIPDLSSIPANDVRQIHSSYECRDISLFAHCCSVFIIVSFPVISTAAVAPASP